MKRLVSLLLCAVPGVGMLPMTAFAEETTDQPAMKYLDSYGREQTEEDYTELTDEIDVSGGPDPGWYVVKGKVSYDEKIYFDDPTHLILCDGAELTINGLHVCRRQPKVGAPNPPASK